MDIKRLNSKLKRYDDKLYAEEVKHGKIVVKRERPRTNIRKFDYVIGTYANDRRSAGFIKRDIARRDVWKGHQKAASITQEEVYEREKKQDYQDDIARAKEIIGLPGTKVFT